MYQMKAKDTLLLSNTITQNPNLAIRAYFWHVASQMCTLHLGTGRVSRSKITPLVFASEP